MRCSDASGKQRLLSVTSTRQERPSMHQPSRLMLAAVALALASSSAALAQSSPMPASMPSSPAAPSSPASGVMTAAPISPASAVPGSTMTSAPSSAPASGSGSSTRSTGVGERRSTNVGADIKQIKSGSLTRSQVVYGLTHQMQEAKQLAKMKTVNFDNLRVYRLPSSLKGALKVSDAETQAIALAVLGGGIP